MIIALGLIIVSVFALVCLAVIIIWPALPLAPFIGLLFAGRGV
jgi:hypothetical protein